MLALFRLPIAVTIIGIVLAGVLGGPQIAGIVTILAILEVSLSFDNAVVNATVLQPGEDPIDVKFLLERAPSGWLVYDVVVDDIGMVENYRAQFDRIIRTRGLSRLEAELRIKQAKLDAMLGN